MTIPSMRVTSVTIGAPDPRSLAAFYSRLLQWPVSDEQAPGPGEPDRAGWAQVRPPDGSGQPTLNFEFEPDYIAPTWPSVRGEQQTMTHLDVRVDDLDASARWAEQAGATLAPVQPQDGVRVMLDPAGHPFCFFRAGW